MEWLYRAKARAALGLMLMSLVTLVLYRCFAMIEYPHSDDLASSYVDFNQSMKTELYPDLCHSHQGAYLLNVFSMVYENNSFKAVKPREQLVIPKIIHIMWLGGTMPEEYEPFVSSWRTLHPQWTIVFWTDNALNYHRGIVITHSFDDLTSAIEQGAHDIVVDASRLNYENKDMYDAAINYGEKSDILKWEIVYRYGGVYVDIDFEALKPLDQLHYCYDFYTGLQPLDTNMVQLGAALFAARPSHPILRECVTKIRENRHLQQIIVKTGPIHFTRCFLNVAGQTGLIDVALPASYLYPCDYNQKGMRKEVWMRPESFAVHHWAGSWLKKEAFTKGYR